MSTVINAETPQSTQQASVCSNIHDLTGILTSDPATWPDYGVASLGLRPQCSLSRDAGDAYRARSTGALKGSCVRWKVTKAKALTSVWFAKPSDGLIISANSFPKIVEAMNAEIASRKRSAYLGR